MFNSVQGAESAIPSTQASSIVVGRLMKFLMMVMRVVRAVIFVELVLARPAYRGVTVTHKITEVELLHNCKLEAEQTQCVREEPQAERMHNSC